MKLPVRLTSAGQVHGQLWRPPDGRPWGGNGRVQFRGRTSSTCQARHRGEASPKEQRRFVPYETPQTYDSEMGMFYCKRMPRLAALQRGRGGKT